MSTARCFSKSWIYCPSSRGHAMSGASIPPPSSSTLEDYFSPPESVRGCKILDKTAFQREVELPAIKLKSATLCSTFLKHLAHACLKFPSIKNVLHEQGKDGEGPSKVLLLAPYHLMKKPLSSEDHEWISANEGEEVTRTVRLGYTDYSKHSILRGVLPLEITDVPSGYETVGHIAHYNLKAEHIPYKYIIGQVTLDKQPSLRTVVNKTDQIDNTYRFFKMEVLAGDEDFMATVKENGCIFRFDFSQVYWNSRLGYEHERVVNFLEVGDTILDVFAGVGPFAIPAAKNRGCTVYANDLNPHSYKYLLENAKSNHVTSKVLAHNLDGREFIKSISKIFMDKIFMDKIISPACDCNKPSVLYSHVLMNLPATAVQFLNVFQGLFSPIPESLRPSIKLPVIHCYCFINKLEDELEMEKVSVSLVTSHLGVSGLSSCSGVVVRLVAPKRVMMRVTFRLPAEVAYSEGVLLEPDCGEPLSKKLKFEKD